VAVVGIALDRLPTPAAVAIPIPAVTPAPVAVIITAVVAIVMAVAIITVAVERIMLGGSIREVSSLDMRPGPILLPVIFHRVVQRSLSFDPEKTKMNVNSSAVLPPAAGIICRAQLAHGLVNDDGKWLLPSSRGVQRRISRRVKPLASWIVYYALLFSLCVSVGAGLLKADVDFSNYDTPLFQQMVNRIKDKGAARLGEGVNTQDRYFIVPFAFQDRWIKPQLSHSFISVIRVLADGKQPSLTPGFRRGRYKNRNFEAFTISWVPHDFGTNPVCVFDGFGSRIFPKWNKCPIVVGRTSGWMRH